MSFEGRVVFFTTEGVDLRETWRDLCRALSVTAVSFASVHKDNSWEAFQAALEGRVLEEGSMTHLKGPSLQEIERRLDPAHCVLVTMWGAARAGSDLPQRIRRGVEAIPSELRGDFVPMELGISIGRHHLFEGMKRPGEYFGLAQASVSFSGSGCPNDWPGTRKAILELPIVAETAERLRPILRDVQVAVCWEG